MLRMRLERDAAGRRHSKQGTEIASGKILLKRDLRADQRGRAGASYGVKLSEQEETNGNTIFFGEFENEGFKSCLPATPTRRRKPFSRSMCVGRSWKRCAQNALFVGNVVGAGARERMCLGYEVVEALFSQLRAEQLCLVTGMTGHVHQIAITGQGRTRAIELLAHNHYAGAAPVSFETYVEQTRHQSVKKVFSSFQGCGAGLLASRGGRRDAAQDGHALNSGSSIFLWARRARARRPWQSAWRACWLRMTCGFHMQLKWMGRLSPSTTLDPQRAFESEPEDRDPRWVLCHRPAVLVGGELTAEMLDLQFNAVSKFYVAPAQMKANNGVLIIDDFGRQRLRPDELLNRWVVPLDRRIDFLTMVGGRRSKSL